MKRKLLIAIPSVLALLAVGVLIFFLVTKGRVYEDDGLQKNTRCSIEFVHVDNDTVYYTVVNDTCRRVVIGDKPTVEKKIDGKWQSFPLWQSKHSIAHVIPPFSRTQDRFEIDAWVWEPTGQYRLCFRGDRYDVVGYFEITEAMLGRMTDHRIYFKDGLRQTKLVQLSETRMEGDTLRFTASNLLDRRVAFSGVMLIQKKEETIWQDFCVERSDGFFVAANSDSEHEVGLETRVLSPGEYRCIYVVGMKEAWWLPEIDPVTREEKFPRVDENGVCAVGYFTVA